ncbi:MAG: type II secretion system protein [Desulfosarcina sp.]|nr:type II secretion system protein [Desulfobacterales bacterium]
MIFYKQYIHSRNRSKYPDLFDKSGFTLVELLAVIVVLSIISAVVVSRFYFSDSNLEAQTEAIKVYLRYAQVRSMNTESVWGINCDGTDLWLYKRYEKDGEIITVKVLLAGEDGVDVNLAEKGISMAEFTVSFNSWGKPCTDDAGQIESTEDIGLTVSSDSEGRNITITKNTGFIP